MRIHLNSRGYGFALFEGSMAPVDWGVVEVRTTDKRAQLLERVREQLERFVPDVVVVQNMTDPRTRRTHRIRRLNETVMELAEELCIGLMTYSRDEVRRCFDYVGPVNKDRIAAAIAKHVPRPICSSGAEAVDERRCTDGYIRCGSTRPHLLPQSRRCEQRRQVSAGGTHMPSVPLR
jgi:hypothetical protein